MDPSFCLRQSQVQLRLTLYCLCNKNSSDPLLVPDCLFSFCRLHVSQALPDWADAGQGQSRTQDTGQRAKLPEEAQWTNSLWFTRSWWLKVSETLANGERDYRKSVMGPPIPGHVILGHQMSQEWRTSTANQRCTPGSCNSLRCGDLLVTEFWEAVLTFKDRGSHTWKIRDPPQVDICTI